MERIKVYTKEMCQPCRMTKIALGKAALEYTEISLADVPELVEEFKAEGHMTAPIVDTGEERWSGFRPDKIKALGKAVLNETTKEV